MWKLSGLMLFFAVSLVSSAKKSNNDEPTQGSSMDNDKGTSKDLMTVGSDQTGMEAEQPPTLPDLMEIMTECNETFRIEIGYLMSLNESGSFPDETDKTPMCYIRCVLENTGVVSLEGEFDPANTAQVFAGQRSGKTLDDLQSIANNCASSRMETCKCERSYRFLQCVIGSEVGINIFGDVEMKRK